MRLRCTGCDFIIQRCLCSLLKTISNKTTLIILQHPSEKNHAINTVKLMKKSFERIHIFIGENFDCDQELQALLNQKKCALLFPGENAEKLDSKSAPISYLILLDGSWKKAKKIFYSTKSLHDLPRFSLEAEIKSTYRIRKSTLENSLSTLEAATQALKIIEPTLDCESLQTTFEKMIDYQIEKMGRDVFEKNYKIKGDD